MSENVREGKQTKNQESVYCQNNDVNILHSGNQDPGKNEQ